MLDQSTNTPNHKPVSQSLISPNEISYNKSSPSDSTAKSEIISPSTKSRNSSSSEDVKEHSSICKRCSMEINVLNLVNSIEYENDDYSSLEFELARASESLSGESSCLSSMDNPNLSPNHHKNDPRLQNGDGGPFEPGFLDYFFGTNSILKKIHLKRSQDNLLKVGGMIPEECGDEEDSTLLKDAGVEKYDKIFGDLHSCPIDSTSGAVSPLSSRRKLKLPERIPDDLSIPKNNFDENRLCDSAEVTVEVKRRSKVSGWSLIFSLDGSDPSDAGYISSFVVMVAGMVCSDGFGNGASFMANYKTNLLVHSDCHSASKHDRNTKSSFY